MSPYPPILNPPALKPPPPKLQYSWESEGYHSGREDDVSEPAPSLATPPPKINVEPSESISNNEKPNNTLRKSSSGWPSYATSRSDALMAAEPVERNSVSPNPGYNRSLSTPEPKKKDPKQRTIDDTKLDKERETFFLLAFGMPMSVPNSCTMDHTC